MVTQITPAGAPVAPPIVPSDAAPDVEAAGKRSLEHVEDGGADPKAERPTEHIVLTHEDSQRIKRKIDKRILVILLWVYYLQILDKLVMGYGNVYGLSVDTGLQGRQYSTAVTMNNIAQLCWMPFSAYIIVKVPSRYLMPALVFGWGAAQTCMAAATNYAGLCVTRFLLGLFEAGCLPLFSIITAQWYRRSEQPIRVCAWYSTNGVGQITAAVLSYGLGKIQNPALYTWQILFIIVGLITVITAPILYIFLDSDIQSARFLTEEEREMALERVRANQNSAYTTEFKWGHIWELAYDPKSWMFGLLALCLNCGASVSTSFGPTLIRGFGFGPDITSLLNIPFGVLQIITIWLGSWAGQRFKMKGVFICAVIVPVLVGCGLLYHANTREVVNTQMALGGYYLLAFLFSGNPLIVSWMIANTGGHTKKSAVLSVYNAFNAIGSIIGPLLFNGDDAPRYLPGIRAVLGVFAAMMGICLLCFVMLLFLNKQRERQRVAVGKPTKIKDTSMTTRYETYGTEGGIGENADKDLTDFKNNEFVYLY